MALITSSLEHAGEHIALPEVSRDDEDLQLLKHEQEPPVLHAWSARCLILLKTRFGVKKGTQRGPAMFGKPLNVAWPLKTTRRQSVLSHHEQKLNNGLHILKLQRLNAPDPPWTIAKDVLEKAPTC